MVGFCKTCKARGYEDVAIDFIKDATQQSGWRVLDSGTNNQHFHKGAPQRGQYSGNIGTGQGANQVARNKPCPDCTSSFAVVMVHWEQSTTEKYGPGHPKEGQFKWYMMNADGSRHIHGQQKGVTPIQQGQTVVREQTVQATAGEGQYETKAPQNGNVVPMLLVEFKGLHDKIDKLQATLDKLVPRTADVELLEARNKLLSDQQLAIEQQQAIDELDEKYPSELEDVEAEQEGPEEGEQFGSTT